MSFWLSVWFLICSISVNLASRLKEWLASRKCLLTLRVACTLLTSFLWLLSLMLKGVSDLPTYCDPHF